jgi:hypothetical protein
VTASGAHHTETLSAMAWRQPHGENASQSRGIHGARGGCDMLAAPGGRRSRAYGTGEGMCDGCQTAVSPGCHVSSMLRVVTRH